MHSIGITRSIYLDYCSTTPTDPGVLETMLPYFSRDFGNASSSSHAFGRRAFEAVEIARSHVAILAGCKPEEVYWTCGATEANNLAVKGLRFDSMPVQHIISQQTEHPSLLEPCETVGGTLLLGVDSDGSINLAELESALPSAAPTLVSVMAANNETGVLQPLTEIVALCDRSNVIVHSDASQIFGKISVAEIDYDLLSVSSHKLYGPKGAGALIVRRLKQPFALLPLLEGGGQERGIRSGTLNVPAIVGFGEACRLAKVEMHSEALRMAQLQSRFESTVCNALSDVEVNGRNAKRLANVCNLAFRGLDAESIMLAVPEIAVSTGSACTSASLKPSHVLEAMGLPEDIQKGSIRISFGRQTTIEEVDIAAAEFIRVIGKLRELSEAWQ